ncbi:MAG: PIN domain-containing protein [Nitrospinae bacterium]|nr:PIN domain-containing protein [Nitrospinota bacterium]
MGVIKQKTQCFVDTNIWLYSFIETDEAEKTKIAKSIIRDNEVFISSQVVNETCVNLLRNARFSEENIQLLITSFYHKYTVLKISKGILFHASKLRGHYNLSFWDSIVVASALDSNCRYLYSEDMQNGLIVEEKMTIVNPFKENKT